MGKSNQKGRSKFEPHLRLHDWLTRSAAWYEASLAARSLLVELYALYRGDNRPVFMSVREAARRLRCGKDRATNALAELQQLGFIELAERGSFNRKVRHASRWRLTEFPDEQGKPGSRAFLSWRPDTGNNKPVPVTGTRRTRDKDRGNYAEGSNGANCPRRRDREPVNRASQRPCHKDTVSLPCVEGTEAIPASMGEIMKRRRIELGWSQRELARRAGVSQPMVAHIEAGNRNGRNALEKARRALGFADQ